MFLALIGIVGLATVSAQDSVPRFEPTDCHFHTEEPLEGVDCGELVVWENREDHAEGTLRLAVAILRSTADDPEPDPVVFLSGGPGGRSVYHTPQRVEIEFWKRVRNRRDIIFYDQRGTGYSDPEFCSRMDRILDTTRYLGLSPEEFRARRLEAVKACREKMLANGIDFSVYNSRTSARDLHDLRQTLGFQHWNVMGRSYGARLALTAMRETPSGIRSVILDSTSPPNARIWVDSPETLARSLERVFTQCESHEACRRTYPDLEEAFHSWLDRLERNPIELTMEDTNRFPQGRLVINESLATEAVYRGLYDRRFPSILPLLINEAGPDADHIWKSLAQRMAASPDQSSSGLNLSVNCYEVAPFNPPAMLEAARAEHPRIAAILRERNRQALCNVWHDERADPSYFESVRSDLPTLILGGEFDPVTPPSYGRLVSRTLSNSTFVEMPAHGHGITYHTACARDMVNSFLQDPGQEVDTSCVSALPSMSFLTDVHVSPGVYPIAQTLQQGAETTVLAGAGFVGLALLSGILGWPIGSLIGRFRGRTAPVVAGLQTSSRWAAALAALLALAFVAGLLLAIRDAVSINPIVLAFGVSGEFEWIFYLPWIVAVLTIVCAFAAVHSWRQEWWGRAQRVHYSLVVGACVVFVVVAGWLGLM